jgi:hypothetical protein
VMPYVPTQRLVMVCPHDGLARRIRALHMKKGPARNLGRPHASGTCSRFRARVALQA